MGNMIALLTLGGFCILASYSSGKIGYGQQKGWVSAASTYLVKPVAIWRTHNAEVIADIFSVSPDEVEKPIDIFHKH